ncbi:alanine/glycine:cation symporter family protein [Acidobacteriota bacterium]
MIDTILEWAGRIDGILWGPWTMVFIAAVGLYLGVRSRFFQFRGIRLIWRNTLGKIFGAPKSRDSEKLTPFQATATALASTVGMGNMAGVATALSVGGPGAIFWMWVFALLGMMTKTVEITLAVHYRETDPDGALHGGPMYYMRKGLGWPFLAKLFSLGILVNSLFTATLIQSHTVGRSFLKSYALNPYITTGAMAVVTAIVIFGGIRRIGRFCEALVPLMSLLYIAGGLVIFILNLDRIPDVFSSIFTFAFAPVPAAGGFAGAAIAATLKQGMARGMLSNEAGLGTAPMVHANADTPHPFQQGLWGAFEVFFDTIVICTITSFAILSTGVLSGGETGIELVIAAFSAELSPGLSGALISVSILTFCLTTQIGFFIYFETAIINLIGRRAVRYLKWFYLVPGVVFAGVVDVDRLWVLANISVGVCSLPNLVAVMALSGAFFKLMNDFLSGQNRFPTSLTDTGRGYVRSPR